MKNLMKNKPTLLNTSADDCPIVQNSVQIAVCILVYQTDTITA